MAISDVSIANLALLKLGKPRIASFSDPTVVAAVFNEHYPLLRDTLQRMGWNFTRAYANLAQSGTAPLFQFTYAYDLPDDYLRVEVAGPTMPPGALPGNSTPAPPPPQTMLAPGMNYADYDNGIQQAYQIVGTQILSNYFPPLSLVYHRRVTDPNQFDVYFVEAFACYLAAQLCEIVTGSNAKAPRMDAAYKDAMAQARKYKSIEQPATRIPDDTFIMSRVRSA